MASEFLRIRPLPDHVINQIAAGEVIERPASVVKELVENSVDAGATRIDIDLDDGGLAEIVVSDDGVGLAGEEILAALRRHWTSKLRDADELTSIATLGFRGEALASIAAVAALEIVSRRRGDAHGWRVITSPGREPSAPVPHQTTEGTRIVVRELFYNVPARKRFLKRGRTEFLHVQQVVRRIAFASSQVGLNLAQAGSRGLRLRPGAIAPGDIVRWRALFGSAFLDSAVFVDEAVEGMRIAGWLGRDDLGSSMTDTQFLALNGRSIRDRQIAHAIREAYGDRLGAGRFPVYALALTLGSTAADVNVHPGKLEVRFVDLRSVHDFVYSAVRRAIAVSIGPESQAVVEADEPVREAAGRYGYAVPIKALQPPSHAHPNIESGPALDVVLGRPLALVEGRFLLTIREERVAVLDLRQAWANVLERRLSAASVPTRPLLIPERLPKKEQELLADLMPALTRLGFEFGDMGNAGWIIRGVPAVLPQLAVAELFACFVAIREFKQAPTATLARAAAETIVLGEQGQARNALLDALLRAYVAADLVLSDCLRPLTADVLAGLVDSRP